MTVAVLNLDQMVIQGIMYVQLWGVWDEGRTGTLGITCATCVTVSSHNIKPSIRIFCDLTKGEIACSWKMQITLFSQGVWCKMDRVLCIMHALFRTCTLHATLAACFTRVSSHAKDSSSIQMCDQNLSD